MAHQARVTRDDLDLGLPRHHSRCPIALAVTRLFPGKPISVSPEGVIGVGPVAAVLDPETTERLAAIIARIDADEAETVEPFAFPLTLPEGRST